MGRGARADRCTGGGERRVIEIHGMLVQAALAGRYDAGNDGARPRDDDIARAVNFASPAGAHTQATLLRRLALLLR